MRIIALIDNPAVIERIPKHLDAWDPQPAFGQHNGRDHPVPNIA